MGSFRLLLQALEWVNANNTRTWITSGNYSDAITEEWRCKWGIRSCRPTECVFESVTERLYCAATYKGNLNHTHKRSMFFHVQSGYKGAHLLLSAVARFAVIATWATAKTYAGFHTRNRRTGIWQNSALKLVSRRFNSCTRSPGPCVLHTALLAAAWTLNLPL